MNKKLCQGCFRAYKCSFCDYCSGCLILNETKRYNNYDNKDVSLKRCSNCKIILNDDDLNVFENMKKKQPNNYEYHLYVLIKQCEEQSYICRHLCVECCTLFILHNNNFFLDEQRFEFIKLSKRMFLRDYIYQKMKNIKYKKYIHEKYYHFTHEKHHIQKNFDLLEDIYRNKNNANFNTRFIIDGDVYDKRYEDYDYFYDSYHLDKLFTP